MANLENLYESPKGVSRSITAENFTGAAGSGGMAVEGTGASSAEELGQGWKISPSILLKHSEKFILAEIDGPGIIRHIWITALGDQLRKLIIRFYWDGQEYPSVEVPLGDFFASGLKTVKQINSIPVTVNPKCAFNCWWLMPFKKHCRIEIENLTGEDTTIYYQIDYTLEEVDEQALYFHASFNRINPLPFKEVFTILDGVEGCGKYVGTYMTWGVNSSGWWGEGEFKAYIDGDSTFPTICGTGTEDYFCGSYDFEKFDAKEYCEFSNAYSGLPVVEKPDGVYRSQMRFSMYRWHLTDPIQFRERIKVTIQALGWKNWDNPNGIHRYLPLQDDISSTAFWYQTLPSKPLKKLPSVDKLEIH
jgi:hypothetical protein